MIVIESNSTLFPTPAWTKGDDFVVTVKRPTENTDVLAARHISWKQGDWPFFCYKWCPEMGERGGKFDHIPRDNIVLADHEHWDRYYQSFKPRNSDPSSGTCAVFSVVEVYAPDSIGLIGFDFVLDNNTDWFHDARAEYEAITSLVDVVDLRDRRNLSQENLYE